MRPALPAAAESNTPLHEAIVSFSSSDDLQLAGRFTAPDLAGRYPAVLFLHGSGLIDSRRGYHAWQDHVCRSGIASLFFEFRGCGESRGEFSDGSLANRLIDAQCAYQFLAHQPGVDAGQMALAGGSMGAHVAVRLLQTEAGIKALVLVSAAAYSEEAEGKPLGAPFSAVIRQPNDWARSPIFEILAAAGKPALLIYSDQDDVIPPGVQDAYLRAVTPHPGSRVVQLHGGGHSLLNPRDEAGQQAMERVFSESVPFLQSQLLA